VAVPGDWMNAEVGQAGRVVTSSVIAVDRQGAQQRTRKRHRTFEVTRNFASDPCGLDVSPSMPAIMSRSSAHGAGALVGTTDASTVEIDKVLNEVHL
jgi:hypothetical protein